MLTYKFRIYPTVEQKQILDNTLETCRQLYNECLEERKIYGIKHLDQKRKLVDRKKTNTELNNIYSQVLQDVVMRLDKTFKKFYEKKINYPKFKRYGRYNSITYPQLGGFQIKNDKLWLSKIGFIRIRIHRTPIGIPKICTIFRDIDRWFACIVTTNDPKRTSGKELVGIDVGLTNWLTLSNGEVIDRPRFMSKSIEKIKQLQRELARKKKGSKNREKVRIRLAKAWRKIRLQREDYCHKISSYLAKRYGVTIFEKLRIKNMVKIHNLAGAIYDSTWYTLKRLAAYKAEVIEVEPKNTTKICSNCSYLPYERLDLKTRIYKCNNCGLILDRDVNAAKNILKLGQELTLVERKPLLDSLESGKLLSMKQKNYWNSNN